jgi:hypothetical protein
MLGGIDIGEYAGFLPGLAVSFVLSLALAAPVGRGLAISWMHAWALLMALGIVVSATLTPSRAALEFGAGGSSAPCDMTRIGPAPLADVLMISDASLNMLLFAPLGIALGLLPRSRRKAGLVCLAIVLPFAIESTQLLAPILGRACQSSDVADNLTGLVLGLAVGTIAGRVAAASRGAGRT